MNRSCIRDDKSVAKIREESSLRVGYYTEDYS